MQLGEIQPFICYGQFSLLVDEKIKRVLHIPCMVVKKVFRYNEDYHENGSVCCVTTPRYICNAMGLPNYHYQN